MNNRSATIKILEADLAQPEHHHAIVELIDEYSKDIMGSGMSLADDVRERLVPGLLEHPTTIVLLAYASERPVGIAVCFRAFSTFSARPLLNLRDFAVTRNYRGCGVGRQLLDAVEQKARELGCCKVTLEVLEGNAVARRLYSSMGYDSPDYESGGTRMLFLSKSIK